MVWVCGVAADLPRPPCPRSGRPGASSTKRCCSTTIWSPGDSTASATGTPLTQVASLPGASARRMTRSPCSSTTAWRSATAGSSSRMSAAAERPSTLGSVSVRERPKCGPLSPRSTTREAATRWASPRLAGAADGMRCSMAGCSSAFTTTRSLSRQTRSPGRSCARRETGRALRCTPGAPLGTRSHRPRRSEMKLAWWAARPLPGRLTRSPGRVPTATSPCRGTLGCSPLGNVSCIRPPPAANLTWP